MGRVVLLLGAKSIDKPLEAVPAEINRLKQLFNTHQPELTVEYEPYLTRNGLGQLLRRFPDQVAILHFAGHSNGSQIQTNDDQVYAQHIAAILETWEHKPRLVFLNGCNNAEQVTAFHKAGIGCVVATQKSIDDGLAGRFAGEFYAELLNHSQKTSLDQAFKRAGALVFMNKPSEPRSIDLEDIDESKSDWDWSIYPNKAQADFLQQWTFDSLIQTQDEEIENQQSAGPLDFIYETKLKHAKERYEQISEWLFRVRKQYTDEVDVDRKIRLEPGIQEKEAELEKIEKEILKLKKSKPS